MSGLSKIVVATDSAHRALDVTDLVAKEVDLLSGAVVVSVPHTTCALVLSEVDDELLKDYERLSRELLRPLEPFTHFRNNVPNANAHILSTMFGTSLLLYVNEGSLDLGTYQRIVLIELDGPKNRQINVRALAKQA